MRCLVAATLILLLVMVSHDQSSPLGKVPLVRDALAQSVSQTNNQTGWGSYSITVTSSNETFTWDGEYTLAACTTPAIPQSGLEEWEGCGYAVGTIEGTISGLACDSHLQYAWRVYVAVGYNNTFISLEVGLTGPVEGFLEPGCGPHNNFAPPPLIPTYCCNESGLAVSRGVLRGVANYSKTGTAPAELPGFTVHWSGMVSISPAQVTSTSSTPEFNANALALAVILPLAALTWITRRGVRKPVLKHANDR
jgi:hypothetical protein